MTSDQVRLTPLRLGIAAAILSSAMVVARVGAQEGKTTRPDTYVTTYAETSRPFDVALATGDGQAFGAIATDPSLSRPEVFLSGTREAAYRAQRPLAGYAAWVLSLGRPWLVAPALAVLFVAGQGAAVAAGASLLARRRGRPEVALLLAALPSSLAALLWFGPEPVGLAFVVGGVVCWERRTRRGVWAAAALFALAALTRESNLVVPLALGLTGLVRRTRPLGDLLPLAIPAAAWAAWAVVVRVRLEWWPWEAGSCRLASTPFEGLATGAGHWAAMPIGELGLLAALGAAVVACIVWRRADDLTWVVVVFAILASFLGECVWRRWEDFSRPLLPLYGLALLALASPACGRVERPGEGPCADARSLPG